MTDLLQRLEALSAPCLEADARIEAEMLCQDFDAQADVVSVSDWNSPAYTASIDAAMSLRPEGYAVNMGDDTALAWAHVWNDAPEYDGKPHEGQSPTLPIALCIAALKARAA